MVWRSMRDLWIGILLGFVVGGTALFDEFVGCGRDSIVVPPTGPGTSYPCGVGWYVCPNSPPAPHRACCRETDVCGGDQGPNLPETCGVVGQCCANGIALVRDAGAHTYEQKRER